MSAPLFEEPKEVAEPIGKSLEWLGDFGCDRLQDMPADGHRKDQDTDREFDEPPNDENGAEQDFEEDGHGDGR